MIEIEELVSLKHQNTFGIDISADYFVMLKSIDDVKKFLKLKSFKHATKLVLGSGSNLLLTDNFKGVIIKPNIKGIEIITEEDLYVDIKVGAGEDWDNFVAWAIEKDFGGLENLSKIPGTVGASPIQNIGAYGAEAKDTILAVEGFFIDNGNPFKIGNFDCEFGYRTSIFKTKYFNKTIITDVLFRLNKIHDYKTGYGSIEQELKKLGETNLSNIRQVVINVRNEKIPDPVSIGNAGSFFKNPVVNAGKAMRLKEAFPDMPFYPVNKKSSKLAAAWLIEKCGWKGFRNGDAGVHDKQALVLVNYGNAKGIEILDLAHKIQESVRNKFEIELEIEVNVIA
jgi:UDP-N-acetylmuramate dehydrogenase